MVIRTYVHMYNKQHPSPDTIKVSGQGFGSTRDAKRQTTDALLSNTYKLQYLVPGTQQSLFNPFTHRCDLYPTLIPSNLSPNHECGSNKGLRYLTHGSSPASTLTTPCVKVLVRRATGKN